MALLLFMQEEDLYKSLFEEQPQCLEEDILMGVIVTLMIVGNHMMNEDILEEDIIMIEVEGHQIEEMTKREVIQEVEGYQIEDPLMMVDPQMMVDPLMMEDPWEMEDLQDDMEDKDQQACQDLLDQCVLS